MNDIIDFENSMDFEVTRLMVKSVDQESEAEVKEFVDMLLRKAHMLTAEYPNAMKYITRSCGIKDSTIIEEYIEEFALEDSKTFFKMCGLLNLLHLSNIDSDY